MPTTTEYYAMREVAERGSRNHLETDDEIIFVLKEANPDPSYEVPGIPKDASDYRWPNAVSVVLFERMMLDGKQRTICYDELQPSIWLHEQDREKGVQPKGHYEIFLRGKLALSKERDALRVEALQKLSANGTNTGRNPKMPIIYYELNIEAAIKSQNNVEIARQEALAWILLSPEKGGAIESEKRAVAKSYNIPNQNMGEIERLLCVYANADPVAFLARTKDRVNKIRSTLMLAVDNSRIYVRGYGVYMGGSNTEVCIAPAGTADTLFWLAQQIEKAVPAFTMFFVELESAMAGTAPHQQPGTTAATLPDEFSYGDCEALLAELKKKGYLKGGKGPKPEYEFLDATGKLLLTVKGTDAPASEMMNNKFFREKMQTLAKAE